MVQKQEARPRAEDDARGGDVLRVKAHWYTLSEASSLLRISEPALRRRISDGSIGAIRSGRSWRILLPGESRSASKEPGAPTPSTDPREHVPEAVALQSIEPLVGLVHDLQRQSLALAGQIGYLQNQLSQTQGQLESLRERAETTVEAPTPNVAITPEEYQRALDEVATLRSVVASWQSLPPSEPSRRGWRFWGRTPMG